jgi:hypothetical protein
VAASASVAAIDTRRRKLNRDEQSSGTTTPSIISSAASGSLISKARKATNVDEFRQKFDIAERTSAGAIVVASASTSAVDTRSRRQEQPSGTTPSVLGSNLHPVLPQGRQLSSPGALPVEGSGLITETDEIFEPQRAPVRAHHSDTGGFLAEAFLVAEDPPITTTIAVVPDPLPPATTVVVPDPLPMKFWTGSRFQWGSGVVLCLIVVGVAIGAAYIAVEGSDGSVDEGKQNISPTLSSSPSLVPSNAPSTSTSPSTTPSSAFERFLPQSLPTDSQDAILVGDTPEAQAFEWLQDDPVVSTYTNLEVLQRYALATLYYATGGENWGGKR